MATIAETALRNQAPLPTQSDCGGRLEARPISQSRCQRDNCRRGAVEPISQPDRKRDHMKGGRLKGFYSTQVWTYLGAALFLVALLVSAIVVPELRLLHLMQALIYVAVIVLARRNSAWGFGAGFAIAIVWNGLSLFVTRLMQAGAVAFWSSLRAGHVEQLVPMMVALGGIGHFILIFATLLALLRHNAETGKWWKFVGGGVLAVAYFVLIVAFAQPR